MLRQICPEIESSSPGDIRSAKYDCMCSPVTLTAQVDALFCRTDFEPAEICIQLFWKMRVKAAENISITHKVPKTSVTWGSYSTVTMHDPEISLFFRQTSRAPLHYCCRQSPTRNVPVWGCDAGGQQPVRAAAPGSAEETFLWWPDKHPVHFGNSCIITADLKWSHWASRRVWQAFFLFWLDVQFLFFFPFLGKKPRTYELWITAQTVSH